MGIQLGHAVLLNGLHDKSSDLLNCRLTQCMNHTFAHLLVHSIVHSIIHSTLCMLYYSSHLCAENQSLLHLFCRSSSRSHVFHFQKALSLICMLTVIFRITTWLVRATPFVDKVVKNAEDSPLECWECDSWIPQTSRQPQQRDCFEQ